MATLAPAREAGADRPVIAIRGWSKRFLGTQALDGVDLDLRRGEVHALLGENGAGKSTLIKMLAGVYAPDSGEVRLDGEAVWPGAVRLPIAFIHQDLGLVDTMTVAENVALIAGYPRCLGLIDWTATRRAAVNALSVLGSDIDPNRAVGELTAADKAIVAIARSLALKVDVVVLDEPTAALPENDVAKLLDCVRRLREGGVAVLYVTHRLDEVFRIADRVTVLRNGRRVSSEPIGALDAAALVHRIVGRPLEEVFVTPLARSGATVLDVEDLRADMAGPVSFRLQAGEVLGLVGLRGAGHEAVGRALFGDLPLSGGQVRLDGRVLDLSSPHAAARQGIGFVSSKRREESLANGLTVRENLFPDALLTGGGAFVPVLPARELARAREVIDRFSVRPRDSEATIATLSGGNQQKVIVARWLIASRRLIVLEEPTLGVDVGAKAEIYALFQKALDAGTSVLLISSDMEEVTGISHRALVFNRGRIAREVPREELSVPYLTALAANQSLTPH
ncbi:MAG: sugar ABC transporter ATP-binding protein [Ancylobacter novellus]|uniref:Sugar ABC transporter ATP-binding protein n=1 Tax=Ancylobacter novellus TaxID=921 RepID=A0A2W5R308_ANCNO|nr:MAG: sugar ABC transporter ATP-binding protein [Ancylobacter novellus]